MYSVRSILVIIALGSTLLGSNAQVTTSCNPLEGVCANDKGLALSSYKIDFASVKKLPSEWIVADNEKVTLGADGAELSFTKRYDAPLMRTDFNIFFGRVEYVVKAAPGTGIISSMVMLSDDLDEVDWEFRGGITDSVQTNYFGKGYTGTYNRSTTESVTSPQSTFHTYAVDWSPTALVWSIDGKTMRTLNATDADGNGSRYPQTPMKVSLSLWDGGDPDTNSGTVAWAGGLTPLPPAQPLTMYVKSVNIWNSNPGKLYQYSDKSGSWKSIKVINDTMKSRSSIDVQRTQTLSLAPTTPISTTATRLPLSNTTSSCSNTSFVSYHSNVTAMRTLSTSLTTSLSSSTQSPGSSALNSTRPCSKISSSSYPITFQSATPTKNATAAPTSNSSSTSSEAAPHTYTSSPSASTIGNSVLAQAATPSISTPCTSPTQAIPIVSSSTTPYTTTSPSVTAAAASTAPSPAITPGSGSPDSAAAVTTNSPAASTSTTDASSPSATDNPFTNTDTDDGDSITDIPDDRSTTDTDTINDDDDTTSTTSITSTTSVTLFITSTGASTNATAAPYPFANGSYVPARGSMASTGASGYAKATSSPLPYSLGDGSRVGVAWSLIVVMGSMACFWGLL